MDSTYAKQHPRLIALGVFVAGAATLALLFALGGVDMNSRAGMKAMGLFGIGGIAAGVGLAQMAWPPPPKKGDGRGFFARASWPQRILWIAGGLVGMLGAAIAQTVASGKI